MHVVVNSTRHVWEGEQSRKKTKTTSQLNQLPKEPSLKSTLSVHFIGQNLITWSYLAVREAGKCSLVPILSKIQALPQT